LLVTASTAEADVWVNGYCKKNGHCVQGYWRTSPNRTITDNYSYSGNVNPHTGAVGHNGGTRRIPNYVTPGYEAPVPVQQYAEPEGQTYTSNASPCQLIPENYPDWRSNPNQVEFMEKNCLGSAPQPEIAPTPSKSRKARF
jgi:hypothetical protein